VFLKTPYGPLSKNQLSGIPLTNTYIISILQVSLKTELAFEMFHEALEGQLNLFFGHGKG